MGEGTKTPRVSWREGDTLHRRPQHEFKSNSRELRDTKEARCLPEASSRPLLGGLGNAARVALWLMDAQCLWGIKAYTWNLAAVEDSGRCRERRGRSWRRARTATPSAPVPGARPRNKHRVQKHAKGDEDVRVRNRCAVRTPQMPQVMDASLPWAVPPLLCLCIEPYPVSCSVGPRGLSLALLQVGKGWAARMRPQSSGWTPGQSWALWGRHSKASRLWGCTWKAVAGEGHGQKRPLGWVFRVGVEGGTAVGGRRDYGAGGCQGQVSGVGGHPSAGVVWDQGGSTVGSWPSSPGAFPDQEGSPPWDDSGYKSQLHPAPI